MYTDVFTKRNSLSVGLAGIMVLKERSTKLSTSRGEGGNKRGRFCRSVIQKEGKRTE